MQLKMTSRRHVVRRGKCLLSSWLLDPLSFPSGLNSVLETIVLSTAEWCSDPDGSMLKCCLCRMRRGPCHVSSPSTDAVCIGCLPLTLQLCTSSGSFGFCPLETARRPRDRGHFTEERFSLFESFPSDLTLLHKDAAGCRFTVLFHSQVFSIYWDRGTGCSTAVVSSVALCVVSDPLKPTVAVRGNGNCGGPVSQVESPFGLLPVLVLEVWSSTIIKVFVRIMAGNHSEPYKFSFMIFLCFPFVTQYFISCPYNGLFYHTFPCH